MPNVMEEDTCSRCPEDVINSLREENKELRNDMKKLYFLTQENKNNLIEHIQILKDENYKLKNEKKELEYRLLINEKRNNELKADNEKYINENKIIQQKYLNEIKELNCQLNNYKIKLNNLSLNYDQLLNEFHYIKKEKIFQMSEPLYSLPSDNTTKDNIYNNN
jgi:chromosome segregation ATPase